MTLEEEVLDLIQLRTEGDYWDFKEYWHDNKASLLHDIICMANNLVNRDAYLIIGVSDSKSPDGVKVKGVTSDSRKEQQQLIGFLRGKKFFGGIRPTIYLQTIMLDDENGEEKPVDVIIVKNTTNTPYYLTENFQDRDKILHAGYIYTRIGDVNTARDSFADVDKIEYLWRKRFGIDLTVHEKLLQLLDTPEDWEGDLNYENSKYHSIFPEFQIRIAELEDAESYKDNCILTNLADHQCDKHFSVEELLIYYHSTIIFQVTVVYLDGARYLIPFPKSETIPCGYTHDFDNSVTYQYYEMDSVIGKLFHCLSCAENNWYCEKWRFGPRYGFLLFHDKSDREQFNVFVEHHMNRVHKEYCEALVGKGYTENQKTMEFYLSGWSKANEIKSWHLYEMYRGTERTSLAQKIPNLYFEK